MRRLPDRTTAGAPRVPLLPAPPPGTDPQQTAADLLLRSWPGRLFIVSTLLKVLVAIVRRIVEPPGFVEVLSSAATIGLIISLGYFVWRLFTLMKRRLLWRVRRKLILSYIFIGFVPALLIVGFVLVSANVVSMNVAGYLFKDGYDRIVADIELATKSAATQIGEQPASAGEVLNRTQQGDQPAPSRRGDGVHRLDGLTGIAGDRRAMGASGGTRDRSAMDAGGWLLRDHCRAG